ncbi:MFS transporter [soil metagenome]
MDQIAKPVHDAAFKKRRGLNWLVLGLTYSTMYMGRYNLSFANKALSDNYGWDKTQIGAIITAALTIYGFSALFNGPIADRIGGKKAMLIGAIGTVVFNTLFGLGGYLGILGKGTVLLGYFTTVWALNAYFQSYSALALIKVNASWFHVKERGVFSAIFGSMIQGGRALIFILGGWAVTVLSWEFVFFIPAVIVAFMSFMTYQYVENSPKDAGLKDFDTMDASSNDDEKVNLKYLFKKVFTNPITLTIAAAEFCTGFVRHGFEQWFPRYMQEYQGMKLDSAIFQSGAFGVVLAGIAGAFVAGMMSDYLFNSRRTPVAFIGYFIQVLCLSTIIATRDTGLIIAAFVLNSFGISVVHSMLSGTASMDFGGRKAAATATGMFDGMQYIGGAAVGVGIGYLLDTFGWSSWAPSMIGFAVIGAILMLVIWNAKPGQKVLKVKKA